MEPGGIDSLHYGDVPQLKLAAKAAISYHNTDTILNF